MPFIPAELIRKKRDGHALSADEISFLINGYTAGSIPDYQIAAWLMAVVLKGMNDEETHTLTQTMLHSGKTLDFSDLKTKKVDKHSTGGVGDKTSLILGPLVAAAGLAVPMISGRGLGHTGGTLDKLESIPGLTTRLSEEKFHQLVRAHGICFMGQTDEICPADKKLYALRDVTGTVESVPLISASIMSKKMAEGLDGLVLDVKFGSGAFMKSFEQAERLAKALVAVGERGGVKTRALLTNMEQPLGAYIGNALEIEECLSILRGEGRPEHEDTRTLSLHLSAHMIELGGLVQNEAEGLALAQKILASGKALEKFEAICGAQGGRLSELPRADHSVALTAAHTGFLTELNCEQVGLASLLIGAGRLRSEDKIDPVAGIRVHKKLGEKVVAGETLFTLYGRKSTDFSGALQRLKFAHKVGDEKPPTSPLIRKII